MTQELHISGIIVHVRRGFEAEIEAAILRLDGAEIHASQTGKIVVTLESETAGQMADTLTYLNGLDGVYLAALVYHAQEDAPDSLVETESGSFPLPTGDFAP